MTVLIKHEIHPLADIFPMMSEEAFQELKADIAANGLSEWGTLFEGKILDGRNRYRACCELGIEMDFMECSDEVNETKGFDPLQFVVSKNLHRRHLDESQRAMVGARLRTLFDEQAKERQKIRKGEQSGASVENLPQLKKGRSRDKAGAAFAVSGKSIDAATKVLKEGTPEQIAAVDQGKVAVSKAAAEIKASATPKPSLATSIQVREISAVEKFRKAKSAAKQHNNAMVRFIDTMNELRLNPGAHRKALQYFEGLDKILTEWTE
jgi:hypothetical protein